LTFAMSMALSALRCPSRALVLHALRAFSSAPLPTTQATQYAPNAKEISLAQVERVAAADLALRRAHDAITVDASDAAEAHRKRLIFRSKQRGWCVWKRGGAAGMRQCAKGGRVGPWGSSVLAAPWHPCTCTWTLHPNCSALLLTLATPAHPPHSPPAILHPHTRTRARHPTGWRLTCSWAPLPRSTWPP